MIRAFLTRHVTHARIAIAYVLAVLVALLVGLAAVSFPFWFVALFLYPAAPPYVLEATGCVAVLALMAWRFLTRPVSWPVGLPVVVLSGAVMFSFARQANVGGTLLGLAVTLCALMVTLLREPAPEFG